MAHFSRPKLSHGTTIENYPNPVPRPNLFLFFRKPPGSVSAARQYAACEAAGATFFNERGRCLGRSGPEIVFDRVEESSSLVLIERSQTGAAQP